MATTPINEFNHTCFEYRKDILILWKLVWMWLAGKCMFYLNIKKQLHAYLVSRHIMVRDVWTCSSSSLCSQTYFLKGWFCSPHLFLMDSEVQKINKISSKANWNEPSLKYCALTTYHTDEVCSQLIITTSYLKSCTL